MDYLHIGLRDRGKGMSKKGSPGLVKIDDQGYNISVG
jgi:hypothetical protein